MKIPLKYKDRRDQGDTVLRQCQLVQLHLLHVFRSICEENNLQYFLSGGSLLGAIRHNGFIPWDDDADVGMPIKDYRKFLKIAEDYLPKDVVLQTKQKVPGCVFTWSKLRDAYSFYAEFNRGLSMADLNGIFIDVIPYYPLPSLGVCLTDKLVAISKKAHFIARCLRVSGRKGMLGALFGAWVSLPFYTINKVIHFVFWLVGLVQKPEFLYYDIDNLTRAKQLSYKAYFPLGKHVFEDGEFSVAGNAERALTEEFGDWRTPPPLEKIKEESHALMILPFQAVMVPGAMKWKERI